MYGWWNSFGNSEGTAYPILEKRFLISERQLAGQLLFIGAGTDSPHLTSSLVSGMSSKWTDDETNWLMNKS